MTLYIGPGIGIGTLIIIIFIILLVLFAFGVVLWIPIKQFFRKIFRKN